MTALVGIQNLKKSYGTQHLFDNLSFSIHAGDRIGLIGPNGAGKSSLLKMMMGTENANGGTITKKQGMHIGYAGQFPEFPALTLEEILTQEIPSSCDIDKQTRARTMLSKAQFTDFSQLASTLSGGWKKRLDIVKAIVADPDLLLLDEPTNHLDLEGILWLEQLLNRERIPFIVISHDRYFLENVTNKIVEINPCYPQGLFIAEGGMSEYMEHKQAFLEAQIQRQKGLASVVRGETDWLRRSPKARTTKSVARIKNAYKLMDELSGYKGRNKVSKVEITFSATERETRKLMTATNVSKSLGGRLLFTGINLVLSPGTRLGIVGKNGTGKSTLLKMLAKEIAPDTGTIKYAEDLRLVYFDQHREKIPMNATLREALSPHGDYVDYHGQKIHVNGWAQRFLFSKERLELPVNLLSGGERARILIAKLILKPADILFLDEPTNDLDIQTLEVIEESLKDFPGAVVLITHDRCMMERLCTQIIGLGEGNEHALYSDYAQWEEGCKEGVAERKSEEKAAKAASKSSNKLTYKEKVELEGIEGVIHTTEEAIKLLESDLNDPTKPQSPDIYRKLAEKQKELENLYNRWEYLSSKG